MSHTARHGATIQVGIMQVQYGGLYLHTMRILFSLLLCLAFLPALSAQKATVRVMSFNIRLPVKADGINDWDHRRPLVASLIRFHAPDLIGVQEAYRRQLDEMTTDMPEYAWYGVCRTDGTVHPEPDGEFSAILYRKDRFTRLDGHTFWLSSTPEKAGSVGWDAALPRIVTWTRLKDKKNHTTFFHFNTHFDHLGEKAREESARLLLARVKEIAGNKPVIITGDFNATDTSGPYQVITGDQTGHGFEDALHISRIPHHGPRGSFSAAFLLPGVGDYRIDYIFVNDRWTVMKHAILADNWDGRLASDHLPVLAVLKVQ